MSKVIAAGIFLVRKNGTLLVCHPTNHVPDFWTIPKGKVEDGESLIAAAIRETYEETNIGLTGVKTIISLDPVDYRHKKKMIYPFVVFERDNEGLGWDSFEFKCNSNVPAARGGFPEMDNWMWCSIEDARKLLHYTQVLCLNRIQKLFEK